MTTAYAPAPDQTAADAVPLDEIRTLVDERGRYDGWLQALDGRRGATPAHVLDRVRQDYAGRLERVAAQLASHVGPLRAHEEALAQQHHAVEQRLGEERDTLAEIELRTLVGEFPADEGEQRRAGAAQAIGALERELGGASAALADVRGLVARVGPAPSAATPGPETAATTATPPTVAPASAGAVGTEPDPADVSLAAAPVEPPQTGTRDTGPGVGGFDAGPAFDHGAIDAARAALGDREVSLTPTFTEAVRSGAGAFGFTNARPQAAEPAAAGQEKTLRCQDCGALNYPTEWYCEKCGGELAAL